MHGCAACDHEQGRQVQELRASQCSNSAKHSMAIHCTLNAQLQVLQYACAVDGMQQWV
jgi:hypothetical protein